MPDSVEVKINPDEIYKNEKALSDVNKGLKNRKVKLQFAESKGGIVNSLITTADRLNEIGVALSALVSQTEKALCNARTSFEDADNTSAQMWEGEE